jgi:hypothetical protein
VTRDQPTTCCYCGDVIMPSDEAVYRLNGVWECTGCDGPETDSCAADEAQREGENHE